MPNNSTSQKLSQLEQRVQLRVAGRQMAEELYALCDGVASIHDPHYVEALVQEFSKLVGYQSDKQVAKEPLEPIARLGEQTLNFGEFGTTPIDDIPLDRLDWYLRKAEETVKLLKSYLNHPELKSRRPHESIP